jgi:hypothetical protein
MCKEKLGLRLHDKEEVNYGELINDVIQELELNSYFGKYEDRDFLVVSDWEEHAQIEAKANNTMDDMLGDDWGFMDEYTCCSGCNKILRTSPTSYGWTPDYVVFDCSILCKDCLDITEYLESIENDPKKANQVYTEAEILEAGYIRINTDDYEAGMHDVHDDPVAIYEALRYEHSAVIFSITDTSQFTINFAVYSKLSKIKCINCGTYIEQAGDSKDFCTECRESLDKAVSKDEI